MTPAYRYRAELVRVIDADTLILRVDLGFRCTVTVTVRVRDVDAPELHTAAGDEAKAAVVRMFEAGQPIVIATYKDKQSFARWVADVWLGDELFADRLRAAGLIKPIGSKQP